MQPALETQALRVLKRKINSPFETSETCRRKIGFSQGTGHNYHTNKKDLPFERKNETFAQTIDDEEPQKKKQTKISTEWPNLY